ncbi:MAG: HAD family hydrolase [Candidatus Thorarchaeota archaeon]
MNVRAVIFDLHHTLTEHRETPYSLVRRICAKHGISLEEFDDDKLERAFITSDKIRKQIEVEQNVNPHFGTQPEDLIEINNIVLKELGFTGVSDTVSLEIEIAFRHAIDTTDFETFTEAAVETVKELDLRGFKLGVCTRRYHSPLQLLRHTGMVEYFSTVQYSGVLGYAKPNPYTLIKAAEELRVNPRHSAFVGNLVDADIDSAIRCEMVPILLTWGNPEEASKAPEGVIVLESPLELLEILTEPGV